MDALEVLMEEHEIILYAIDVLGESTKRFNNGKNVPMKFFEDFLEIVKNFADRCHHGKEETVLFPLIETRDSSQHDVISVLFAEHEKGRKFLAKLRDAAGTNNVKEITESSGGYANLLKLHIQKENLLFPKWLSILSDDNPN